MSLLLRKSLIWWLCRAMLLARYKSPRTERWRPFWCRQHPKAIDLPSARCSEGCSSITASAPPVRAVRKDKSSINSPRRSDYISDTWFRSNFTQFHFDHVILFPIPLSRPELWECDSFENDDQCSDLSLVQTGRRSGQDQPLCRRLVSRQTPWLCNLTAGCQARLMNMQQLSSAQCSGLVLKAVNRTQTLVAVCLCPFFFGGRKWHCLPLFGGPVCGASNWIVGPIADDGLRSRPYDARQKGGDCCSPNYSQDLQSVASFCAGNQISANVCVKRLGAIGKQTVPHAPLSLSLSSLSKNKTYKN